MNKFNNSGFGAVGVLIVVVVIAVVGLVGYKVYDTSKSSDDKAQEITTSVSDNPTIQNAQDLDSTAEELNSQDIDAELDTSDIDATLN